MAVLADTIIQATVAVATIVGATLAMNMIAQATHKDRIPNRNGVWVHKLTMMTK